MNVITRKRISQADIDFVNAHYPRHGGKYCAEKLGRTLSSIHNIAKKHNIVVPPGGISNIFTAIRRKSNENYNVNADMFITPRIPSVIYTMGLLWADGTINTYKNSHRAVCLKSTFPDGDEFYKIMSSFGKWNYYKYDVQNIKYKHLKPSIQIQTNNRPMVEFLESVGYRTKSVGSADSVLEIIPLELRHYWFRGLFDGDGCLYVKDRMVQVTLSGPINQSWKYLTDLLSNLGVSYSVKQIITVRGSSSVVRFTGALNCKRFLDYIYKNATQDKIYLSRKYEKYLML